MQSVLLRKKTDLPNGSDKFKIDARSLSKYNGIWVMNVATQLHHTHAQEGGLLGTSIFQPYSLQSI